MQKAITIYTPPESAAHITAEDDAFIHDTIFGRESGAIGGLTCVKINDNLVRLSKGGVSNRGYVLYIPTGDSLDLGIETGPIGQKRSDLVIARFVKGGGSQPDTHEFRIVQGTPYPTEGQPSIPSLAGSDLAVPASVNEVALFWVHLTGTAITSVERFASEVGPKRIFIQSSAPIFPKEGDLWFW